ncbi:hypothetical protein CPLU01_14975 [Colletotrichum plurivorum]|uniref:F-box domain-containing protein n=1 Tax=Colletotrichum plurivorum TaxID=2175906 RepID=A0A8H6JFP8_9PEZI|nr:hypothetical protein CPLU01_14975 [Colletotrichum plurivorum]
MGENPVSGHSTIELLPTEMILQIAENLEPWEVAAFALSSKRILYNLGTAAVKVRPKDRYAFFQLLERDLRHIPQILCAYCSYFHAPEESLMSKRHCCVLAPTYGRGIWNLTSPLLPTWLHWNMVKAVMQSHREGTGYHTVEDLKSTKTFSDDGTRVHYTARYLISNGKLILRTALALLPCKGGAREQTAFAPELANILRKNKLEASCGHVLWTERYPRVFSPQPEPGTPSSAHPLSINYRPCIWNTRRKKPLKTFHAADMKQCRRCHTSYTLMIKDLEDGGGRMVCLVSYKDLGKGESRDEPEWNSHMWHNTKTKQPKVRRGANEIRYDWGLQTSLMPESDVSGYGLEDWCFASLINRSRQW